jgi:hypothetical protein
MVIAEAEREFRAFMADRGKDPGILQPEEVLLLALEFYERYPATDALPRNDQAFGDGLLFQWGSREAIPGHYDACFYLDVTRQFISVEGEDDDAMFQLSCQVQYEACEELRVLGYETKWCWSMEALPEFREYVLAHPVLRVLTERVPRRTEVAFSGV